MSAVSPSRSADEVAVLPDRRRLGFCQAGNPNGAPAFVFHGIPGSRLTAIGGLADPGSDGPRYISPDRPGMGLSDYQRGRRLLDWPADVAHLADALGIGRFAVLGASGGGPYALACAYRFPERLTAAVVINSMAPLDAPGALAAYRPLRRAAWWTVARVPMQERLVSWLQYRTVVSDPQTLVRRMAARMAPEDRAALRDPQVADAIARQVGEAFRQGWRGVAHDVRIVTRPWGFRPADVRCEVHLWQGENDHNVPRAMGERLAAEIPDCRARFVPGGGHLLHARRREIEAVLAPAGGL